MIVECDFGCGVRRGELGATRTLAFYSHVDVEVRERAIAAGFDLVVPRSRMNREGAELVTRLLPPAAVTEPAAEPPYSRERGREQPRDVGALAHDPEALLPRGPGRSVCGSRSPNGLPGAVNAGVTAASSRAAPARSTPGRRGGQRRQRGARAPSRVAS